MVNRALILILSMFTFNALALSQITATVSENPAIVNESINLIVTVDDNADANIFDFNQLTNDFRVLGTSVSSETRMINFNTTRLTRFTTRLIPKKTGTITIPAFSYKGVSSSPIQLTVEEPNSQQQNNGQQAIFVETELSKDQVWLQQQVTYVTRLYLSVQIASGSLTQPEIAGALIEQEGKDKESDKIINGIAYRVIERTYKITPQRSGEFIIDSPVFQAEVVDGRRSQFRFNQTKTINRVGQSQKLMVKAIPEDYIGHWLPSELVMLNDELQPVAQTYQVGEPITRVITLSALDVSPEQLPEIKPTYPVEIKVYPDQADTHSNLRGEQFISQRIETTALVPTQAGKLELPEIKLNWWNTKTETMEVATIPAKTIEIIANPNSTNNAPPLVQPKITTPDNKQIENKNSKECETTETILNAPTNPWQFNYLSMLLIALWLLSVTLIIIFVRVKYLSIAKATQYTSQNESQLNIQNEKLAWSRLTKACNKNNIAQIQQQLPIWVAALYQNKDIITCHQAINLLDNSIITSEISAMQATRFSQEKTDTPTNWQSQSLLNQLTKIRQLKLTQQQQINNLAPLNP